MKLDTVLAKVKQIQDKERKQQLKWASEYQSQSKESGDYWERSALRCKKSAQRPNGTAIPFRSRKGKFEKRNLDFDPVTGLGHSYSWYQITKMIKGKLVLNTYRYSSTTGKHVYNLRSLFKQLGLKYVEIQAPRGLQALDRAAEHHAYLYAKLVVENKYARKPSKRAERMALKDLALVKSLGGKVTKAFIKEQIERAERARQARLERDRAKRKLATVTFVEGTQDNAGIQGHHVIISRWSVQGVIESRRSSRYERERLAKEALDKGFSTVIVHAEQESV